MGTELAIIEPIQLPARPDQMPSWPAWLRQRSDVLESGTDLLPNGLPDPFAVADAAGGNAPELFGARDG
jgi:hypothetical protein